MNIRDIFMILGIGTFFFVVAYAFVSIMTGMSLHLQPLGFNTLVISVILGMLAAFVNMYIREDKEDGCDELE